VLRGGHDRAVVFEASGHVEQSEEDAVWSDANEIMEVAALALAEVGSRQLGSMQLRDFSLHRFLGGNSIRFVVIEEEGHGPSSLK
jgi:hypothetical protein